MHADENDSGTGYEPTSGNGRPTTCREADLEYLAGEAQAARMAVRASLSELKATLLATVHPRELTRRHPRVAIGLAAAAGVTAGVTAGASMRGRSRPRPRTSRPGAADEGLAEASRPGKSELGGRAGAGLNKVFELAGTALRGALIGALRLALQSIFTAWITPPTVPESAAGGPADLVTPADAVPDEPADIGS